jgi:hypothetical protein
MQAVFRDIPDDEPSAALEQAVRIVVRCTDKHRSGWTRTSYACPGSGLAGWPLPVMLDGGERRDRVARPPELSAYEAFDADERRPLWHPLRTPPEMQARSRRTGLPLATLEFGTLSLTESQARRLLIDCASLIGEIRTLRSSCAGRCNSRTRRLALCLSLHAGIGHDHRASRALKQRRPGTSSIVEDYLMRRLHTPSTAP